MSKVLAKQGASERFWKMVEEMKKSGFEMGKGMRYVANELFCARVCEVIRRESWSDDVEKQLLAMNVEYSSDVVSRVVTRLGIKDKGLMFFKWIEESGLVKHDQHTFNAMLKVLADKYSSEQFWKMAEEMKKYGFEMERDTRFKAKQLFFEKRTIYDCVNLLEFAMGGVNKVSVEDRTSLLTSILQRFMGPDMELFSLVVRIFKEHGIAITDSMFEGILRSLGHNGNLYLINMILEALEVDGGFVPRVAIHLTRREKKSDEASEFTDNMEAPDSVPDYETWSYLISGFCWTNELEKASSTLQEMVKYVRTPSTRTTGGGLLFNTCPCPIDTVVTAYCNKKRAVDAFNLVSKLMQKNNVRPRPSTLETLIHKLLAQGGFREALNVVTLMNDKGYPPPELFVFIEHLSERGSRDDDDDDAMAFLDTITALYKLTSNDFARDLLLKCPENVRNNPKVLKLFSCKKTETNASVPEKDCIG